MYLRAFWVITVAAAVLFGTGLVLSRRVEPGIRVDAVTLADATPAIRFLPMTADSHPIALLAHGITASKETLFRYCEALAVAGFACFAIDLPGHGESPRPLSREGNAHTIGAVSQALGSVDVFLGHSMGASAGAASVRAGHLSPRLFIAVGALPDLGRRGPPLLLLAGRFEEAVSVASLRARRNARLVVSPWSDHALEPYDPVLVNAAVEAASVAVGKVSSDATTQWRWRLLGVVLAMFGGLVVGAQLPELFPSLARFRGALIVLAAIAAIALTGSTWLGTAPIARHVPVQLVTTTLLALVFVGLGKLKVPRWSLIALAAAGTLGCVVAQESFLAFISAGLMLVLCIGTAIAWIATRRGTRRDGDIALAIFVGYVVGQWTLWNLGVRLLGLM